MDKLKQGSPKKEKKVFPLSYKIDRLQNDIRPLHLAERPILNL
jgi:hypothetical protein